MIFGTNPSTINLLIMIKPIASSPAANTPKTDMVRSLERTFKRIDKGLRAEHKRLGLPLVVWKDGRVQKIKA